MHEDFPGPHPRGVGNIDYHAFSPRQLYISVFVKMEQGSFKSQSSVLFGGQDVLLFHHCEMADTLLPNE